MAKNKKRWDEILGKWVKEEKDETGSVAALPAEDRFYDEFTGEEPIAETMIIPPAETMITHPPAEPVRTATPTPTKAVLTKTTPRRAIITMEPNTTKILKGRNPKVMKYLGGGRRG